MVVLGGVRFLMNEVPLYLHHGRDLPSRPSLTTLSHTVHDTVRLSSSLLLASLELSDTKSMSLRYEPSPESLHISAK